MTSGITRTCRPFWGAYSASKAALDAMGRTYAQEVQKTPIRVVIISPGPTRTGMRAQAMPGEDPMTLPHPSEIVPHLIEIASPGFRRTNVLFDFPTKSFSEYPAGVATTANEAAASQ
jgi:NAD(P)-dependent dehydrogenase (short-subunit alcohol dehydrogenase family)